MTTAEVEKLIQALNHICHGIGGLERRDGGLAQVELQMEIQNATRALLDLARERDNLMSEWMPKYSVEEHVLLETPAGREIKKLRAALEKYADRSAWLSQGAAFDTRKNFRIGYEIAEEALKEENR